MTTSSSPSSSSTRSSRGLPRFAALAIAGVVALGALAGCVPTANVAVQVGDQKVSMGTFQADVDACSSLANSDTMSPRQIIATTLTQGAVGEELLARSGRTLSTAQRDAVMQQNNLTALDANPTCREMGRRLAALYAVAQTSDQATLLKQINSLDIQVNPQLGHWYPEQLAVAGSSSLSILWAGPR